MISSFAPIISHHFEQNNKYFEKPVDIGAIIL